MKILVKIRTNKIGSECFNEFDLDDDSTPEEIEELAQEVAFEMVDWSYKIL